MDSQAVLPEGLSPHDGALVKEVDDLTLELEKFGFNKPATFHPLVKAALHNLVACPFLQLPLDIFLDILQYAGVESQICLRQVCRIMPRLFCYKPLQARLQYNARKPSTIGQRHHLWPKEVRKYAGLLSGQQRFCLACYPHRYDWNNYLYCSGCKQDHQTTLFSLTQRYTHYSERICVGLEGHIQLCRHQQARWQDIATHFIEKKKSQDLVIECTHDSHDSRTRQARPCMRVVKGGFGKYPARKGAGFQVYLRQKTHIVLPDRPGRPNAMDLQSCLEKLDQSAPCSWFPATGTGPLNTMRCFDPTKCDCLEFTGPANFDWPGRPLCEGGDRKPRAYCSGCFAPKGRAGKRVHDSHRLHLDIPKSHTTFDALFERCTCGSPRCLVLTRSRRIRHQRKTLLFPSTLDWQFTLDPASFKLLHDDEMNGRNWCDSDRCANFYRCRLPSNRSAFSLSRENPCPWVCSPDINSLVPGSGPARDHFQGGHEDGGYQNRKRQRRN